MEGEEEWGSQRLKEGMFQGNLRSLERGPGRWGGGRNQLVTAEVMTHQGPGAPSSCLSPHPVPGPLGKPSPSGLGTCRRGSPEDGAPAPSCPRILIMLAQRVLSRVT